MQDPYRQESQTARPQWLELLLFEFVVRFCSCRPKEEDGWNPQTPSTFVPAGNGRINKRTAVTHVCSVLHCRIHLHGVGR